ncbi:MAG: AbrB/MazE/SpoVT family DNA-binding domain-containing protein [Chloroflexi bacterium]|nr:AbrB/MazE/SpoVT family DNA-binding domain-containing protein [Chloroflexota bacterium]
MENIAARLSTKYQVVIPKAVRDALKLEPDSTLLFLIEGDQVTIRPQPPSFADALRGLHKEMWAEPETWLEQERATWA